MIKEFRAEAHGDADERVRSVAAQFRKWLDKSLEDQMLKYDDAGVLALYTLITMKGGEILELGGDETSRWVVGMGAFLSECIRARFGGDYFASGDQGFGLRIDEATELYPLRWVQDQLANGIKGSILLKYQLLVESRGGDAPRLER